MNRRETDLEKVRKEPHVSHSQIRTYLICPRRYFYQYVKGIEWQELPAVMVFGKAIHEAVAVYYRQTKEQGSASYGDMLEAYKAAWEKEKSKKIPLAYKKKDTEDSLLSQAAWLLEVFVKHARPQIVEAVEMPFSVELVSPEGGEKLRCKLVGIFDMLESDGDGNLIISELKTASRRQQQDGYENHLQATIYSYALKMLGYTTSGRRTLVRYDVLLRTKIGGFDRYYVVKTERDYHKMFSLIKEVLRAIELGIYYPCHGWQCSDCPFRGACARDD